MLHWSSQFLYSYPLAPDNFLPPIFNFPKTIYNEYMTLESELCKLRHPSNSKNFSQENSVPSNEFTKPAMKTDLLNVFPITKVLAEELKKEYAEDVHSRGVPYLELLIDNHAITRRTKALKIADAYVAGEITHTEYEHLVVLLDEFSAKSKGSKPSVGDHYNAELLGAVPSNYTGWARDSGEKGGTIEPVNKTGMVAKLVKFWGKLFGH